VPELSRGKGRPHPAKSVAASPSLAVAAASPPPRLGYAELHAVSNFSFLRGASHPDELVETAATYGYDAIALTDASSLAGVVRAHVKAKEVGIKLIVGAEIALSDAASVVVLAPDRAAYGRLSRLLSVGRRRATKGRCDLRLDDLVELHEGLVAIVLPDEAALSPTSDETALAAAAERMTAVATIFGARASLAYEFFDGPDDALRLRRLDALAERTGLLGVATGGIEAHAPSRRFVRDVLSAVAEKRTVAASAVLRPADGARPLMDPATVRRRFAGRPELLSRAVAIAATCAFSLDELRYEYPVEGGIERLRDLAFRGARERYPQGVPEKVRALLEHELALIEELRYASYFLTVYEIVAFARSRGILCQGRGSAANSATCFCLGVTCVDPDRFDVLFERFISRDRAEPPDIDVDFEHERREEVLQHLYATYGRERCALAATVITYRGRSALRDVAKALGMSLDAADRLAGTVQWRDEADDPDARLSEAGFDPKDPTLRRVLALASEISGFPRHLSQHVGGMVLSRGRVDELCPIENAAMDGRTVLQWDKDDLDALGLLKVDCLALGMLTAIRKACDAIHDARGVSPTLTSLSVEDPAVYAMIQKADTVGVFQIESRAQMAMLPRLKPACFYDLVIEVAIVRPGPIQGGMVHPYLRRREGSEPVSFPSEEVRAVLEKTAGVPIFQEQAMRLAVVAAGFTPGEADQLRRAMGAWRKTGSLDRFRTKLRDGMLARGYDEAFAEALYAQISGFGEYGFPESHAASFAALTYASCALKRYEPAAFLVALLNSQPLGFYAPAQLVYDARTHGVPVRDVDATRSAWDCALETDGLPPLRPSEIPTTSETRVARRERPFESIDDLRKRAELNRREAGILADAGAFRALADHRRDARWRGALPKDDAPLFRDVPFEESAPPLKPPTTPDLTALDYATKGLSLTAHPLSILRAELDRRGATPCASYARLPDGSKTRVAGLVITRQRPATASGILFATLEDETGIANVVVRVREQIRHRAEVLEARLMVVDGRVERRGDVVHLVASKLFDLTEFLSAVPTRSRDWR
jgi:error-prone DNA polymerase